MGKTVGSIPGAGVRQGSKLLGKLGGTKGSIQQASILTGEQQASLSELLNTLQPQIADAAGGLDFDLTSQQGFQRALELANEQSQAFDPTQISENFQMNVADPALKQFNQQILPGIQERGIAGGQGRSSGVQRQMAAAGTDLQTALSGQLSNQLLQGQTARESLRQGTIGQLLGLAQAPQQSQTQNLQGLLGGMQLGLGTQAFQNYAQPGKPSKAGAALGLLGTGIGGYFGGPAGAQLGGSIGSSAGALF
jgi:hypothetical protein